VHGLKDKSVSLDLDRLQAIRERVDTPLVLHGSSGVNNEDIDQGIKLGLVKINIATQLSKAFTGAVRAVLSADEELVDPRKYMILCVNLNAAIDKTIVVNDFQMGDIHRPEAVNSLAGERVVTWPVR
jgi:fructose/tagatose bisphosphate aldolase